MKKFFTLLALLLMGGVLSAGPIIIAGMDPEDHGSCPFGSGCEMIRDIVLFVTDNSSNGGTGVLMLGGNFGPIGGSGIDLEDIVLNDLNPPHNRFHHASTPAQIAALPFPLGSGPGGQFAAIYMPTSDRDITGGLTFAQLAQINIRGVEIVDFVNAGGGLVSFSQNIPGGFDWFPLGGLETTDLQIQGDTGICVTPEGSSILSPSATLVEPYHTTFDGPPGFFGLDVLARHESGGIIPECDGSALIIGGLSVTIEECDPICEQRTQGFWRRVCAKPHPEEPNGIDPYVSDVVSLGSPLFDGFGKEEICDLMEVLQPENDPCRKARRQFVALLLNIASERLTACQDLLQGSTVQDAIDSIKVLIQTDQCKLAQAIAAGINEGTSLAPCDSILLTRIGRPVQKLSTPSRGILLQSKKENPIRDEAVIEFNIPSVEVDESNPLLLGSSPSYPVSLTLYNLSGQKVRTLLMGNEEEGVHRVTWNGMDDAGEKVPSGIYILRLASGKKSQSLKLVLLR